jgi:hypothetical protein
VKARRTATRAWFRAWKHAGATLEAERWKRLHGMTERARAIMVLDLLSLWRPGLSGDDAEALVRAQRAFALWRKKHV